MHQSVCCRRTSRGVCVAEQQQNCSRVCSQWVKHVVLHSGREDTTEQIIIMIQSIVTPWIRATPQPSVLCPWTAGHLCICVCRVKLQTLNLTICIRFHSLFFPPLFFQPHTSSTLNLFKNCLSFLNLIEIWHIMPSYNKCFQKGDLLIHCSNIAMIKVF